MRKNSIFLILISISILFPNMLFGYRIHQKYSSRIYKVYKNNKYIKSICYTRYYHNDFYEFGYLYKVTIEPCIIGEIK